MNGPDVRRVAEEIARKRGDGVRVDGLQDDLAAGRELVSCEREEALELIFREMLDELRSEHAAERGVRLLLEVREEICALDREIFFQAAAHHGFIEVDAARVELCFQKKLEKLATAAAHIENGARNAA